MAARHRPVGFFVSRWRGDLPLARLFWRDMVVFGTALNLLVTFVALAISANRAPIELAAAVHFSTLPYNVFLFAAVWRNADRRPGLRLGAALWLLAATLL